MIFQFTIIKRDGTSIAIEDPMGWDATSFVLQRDENKHGVSFNYQAEEYEYTGKAAKVLREEYNAYGIQGKTSLKIEYKCLESDSWKLAYTGSFDFGNWDNTTGENCNVKLSIEDDTAEQTLSNMLDQKVNLQSTQSLNGVALPAYSKLGMNTLLPGKSIFVADHSENKANYLGSWKEANYLPAYTFGAPSSPGMYPAAALFVPGFDSIISSEIGGYIHPTGATATPLIASADEWMFGTLGKWSPAGAIGSIALSDPIEKGAVLLPYDPLTGFPATRPYPFAPQYHYQYFMPDNVAPVVNYDSTLGTVYGGLPITNLSLRLKFQADFDAIKDPVAPVGSRGTISACMYCGIRDAGDNWRWLSIDPAVWATYRAPLGSETLPINIKDTMYINKDITLSGITLNPGDRLYYFHLIWYYRVIYDLPNDTFRIRIYKDNTFNLSGLSTIPATTSKTFMVNEALSRVVESITDNKIKVYSQYFGRTDSQPYSHAEDGCGALRTLTNGLFIRRIDQKRPITPPIFSTSLNALWNGLNPIDNLGMGVEDDPVRPGFKRLRVERFDFFYSDEVVFSCQGVKEIKRKTRASSHINTFKFGYSKWEAEAFNGIDEFLTNREYRTTLNQIRSTFQVLSTMVASGFALEVTRRKGNDTSEDFKYDNDIFIVCMKRQSGAIVVEQGGITDAENIIDPDTIYNWRIRPLYNAMRWAPHVFASYKNFDVASPILFSDGTGNFYAKGKNSSSFCKITDEVLSEKDTILPTQFLDSTYPTPIWELEDVVFDFPMTIDEFNDVRNNPNGLIYFENETENGYGWIRNIKHSPNDGLSTFTLKPKI